jgi:hypothetical protein
VDTRFGTHETRVTSSPGVPQIRNILCSWSISESPGNSVRLLHISASMHPVDLLSER